VWRSFTAVIDYDDLEAIARIVQEGERLKTVRQRSRTLEGRDDD
jgi:hypothetical protein